MSPKCKFYKGCYVAPGSNLFALLESKDPEAKKLAEKAYVEIDKRFKQERDPGIRTV